MNITILGSGNVATHLGKAFLKDGHRIQQVYSRTLANAQALALLLDATAVNSIEMIQTDADLYLLAVSDQAIGSIAAALPQSLRGIVVHCSGATSMESLAHFQQYGVIYPPQSLRKENDNAISEIPFAVEGNTLATGNILMQLMQKIASKSFSCSSQQRLALHVAAVFANNFTNSLFQISFELVQAQGLSFDLIHPIMLETVQKALQQEPRNVQTGPAQRGDKLTIEKHLKFISEMPNWVKIYQQLTEEISSKKDK